MHELTIRKTWIPIFKTNRIRIECSISNNSRISNIRRALPEVFYFSHSSQWWKKKFYPKGIFGSAHALPRSPQVSLISPISPISQPHCFSGLNVIRAQTGDLSWMKVVILAWFLSGPWYPQVCLGSPQISPGSSQDSPESAQVSPKLPHPHCFSGINILRAHWRLKLDRSA